MRSLNEGGKQCVAPVVTEDEEEARATVREVVEQAVEIQQVWPTDEQIEKLQTRSKRLYSHLFRSASCRDHDGW